MTELQDQGGKRAAARLVGLRTGPYSAGSIEATFAADGSFTLTPKDRQTMTGQYAVDGSTLTLKGVKEAADSYKFPMTCVISFEPTGFSLTAPKGSESDCAPLARKTFAQN